MPQLLSLSRTRLPCPNNAPALRSSLCRVRFVTRPRAVSVRHELLELAMRWFPPLLIVLSLSLGLVSRASAVEVYRQEVEAFADVKVYLTDVEAFADCVIYVTDVEAFATGNAVWYWQSVESFADLSVYVTDVEAFADVTVYLTGVESFAHCDVNWVGYNH